ncbi:hypothetical protein PoB_002016800 [Plakobranchus ocellatus]|uniref:Uncharacterized protein n=1 Tax=Plakobranchus ocellatus TaxID=259542 RepID=A0AAV3ZFV9_9GAST|nr:hypothetical protein PoB_002016800 [Plakobranchus ocellatus]
MNKTVHRDNALVHYLENDLGHQWPKISAFRFVARRILSWPALLEKDPQSKAGEANDRGPIKDAKTAPLMQHLMSDKRRLALREKNI